MKKGGKTVLKETSTSARRTTERDFGTVSSSTFPEPKRVITLSEEEVAKLPQALLLFVKTYAEL